MADRVAAARQTYLVEHYRPGLTADELMRWAGRIGAATDDLERNGKPVRYLRSLIVPADESLLCVVEAAGEELVREAHARSGLPFARLSIVLSEEAAPSGGASRTEGS